MSILLWPLHKEKKENFLVFHALSFLRVYLINRCQYSYAEKKKDSDKVVISIETIASMASGGEKGDREFLSRGSFVSLFGGGGGKIKLPILFI